MDVTGLVVLLVALAALSLYGLWLRRRDGRVRAAEPGSGPSGWDLADTEPQGRRALLLQLSSPACAPCRQTAEVLGSLVAADAGLAHVEVDVAEHQDVARTLGVLRTPTTVVFDAEGAEVLRVSGVPRVDELTPALPHPGT
ncbi:thioredoxin family protein [Pseudonocardia phyllosphaerae]|uniref:thioredoxin family protein n=1 Tax=Pseudonocardia phyllosphaerae TaxID=3390502 RepID=UPI00397D4A95